MRILLASLRSRAVFAAIALAEALLLGIAAASASVCCAQTATLVQINAALENGEADKALSLIGSLPQAGANDAEAQNLACRVRFTLQQWNAAAGE
jgi:hypothetical protein